MTFLSFIFYLLIFACIATAIFIGILIKQCRDELKANEDADFCIDGYQYIEWTIQVDVQTSHDDKIEICSVRAKDMKAAINIALYRCRTKYPNASMEIMKVTAVETVKK